MTEKKRKISKFTKVEQICIIGLLHSVTRINSIQKQMDAYDDKSNDYIPRTAGKTIQKECQ